VCSGDFRESGFRPDRAGRTLAGSRGRVVDTGPPGLVFRKDANIEKKKNKSLTLARSEGIGSGSGDD